jgi:hypothetical protein
MSLFSSSFPGPDEPLQHPIARQCFPSSQRNSGRHHQHYVFVAVARPLPLATPLTLERTSEMSDVWWRGELRYSLYMSPIHVILCLISVMAALQQLRITASRGSISAKAGAWRPEIARWTRLIRGARFREALGAPASPDGTAWSADPRWSHCARPLVLVGRPPTMWICIHGLTS